MNQEIQNYNNKLSEDDINICNLLAEIIDTNLATAENKIWHGHPVWFINGNPIVGYSKLKSGVQLLFWSGQSFEEKALKAIGKFKASGIIYNSSSEINSTELINWLEKSKSIQWDYKNIVKNKGLLERLL